MSKEFSPAQNTTKRLLSRFEGGSAAKAFGLAILIACAWGGAPSQSQMGQGGQLPTSQRGGIPQDPNFQNTPFNDPYGYPGGGEKRMRAINAERQKALTADTAKLFKLATELNEEIAKSNPGELSANQLRKVAEIEKLAHGVREKMIMSVRGPQFNIDETPPSFPPRSPR